MAGGLLLFLHSLSLTFSGPGLSSISEGERRAADRPGDILTRDSEPPDEPDSKAKDEA